MKNPKYQLKAEQDLIVFRFISQGMQGDIQKRIEFNKTNLKDFYNLAFGDEDILTGAVNDKVVTNNNDTEKVLTTVASAVYAFTDRNPEAWVYATGSTPARTRLYRMSINKYFLELDIDFYIVGELGENWLEFEKNTNYEGFAIKRREKE